MNRRCLLTAGVVLLTATAASAAGNGPADPGMFSSEQLEFFEKKVRPALAANCFKCHGPEKQKGGLRLDSRAAVLKGGESGPAAVAGKPDDSELVAAINYDPAGYQMPPTGRLKPDEIAVLTEWVRLGLPWPDAPGTTPATTADGGIDLAERAKHWSFQPVRDVPRPAVARHDWPRNAIDHFILAKLEAAGLAPAPEADKRTLLRRVTYDLIGLPPTGDEIAAFLADDSPDTWAKVVDRLLASPHYGERWGRHWLDLVRFAETYGHEYDYEIPHASPYRDYVVRALNDDVPYNQFVVEHIAGDLLDPPRRHPTGRTNESVIGTGFYWFAQGKHSPVDIRAEECELFDNQIDVLSKTFLGLTVACARCHDHKFDAITTRDYYALAGYLQSSRQQYAFIDPPERIDAIANELRQSLDSNRDTLIEATAASLRFGIERLPESPPSAGEPKGEPLSDILAPWRKLASVKAGDEFIRQRESLHRQLKQQLDASRTAAANSVLFEDFDGGTYANWFVTGAAFGNAPARGGELLVRNDPAQPVGSVAPYGVAHSGLVSGRLHGVLRSQTFTIDRPFLWYRACRVGGKENTGRLLKNGHLHLIVDGFQHIRNPLYGQLSIGIPLGAEFKWHRQNAARFIGHKAYIEIEDADDGYIVVDRILFSDADSLPEPPNELIVRLLDDPEIDSAGKLSQRYRQLLARTLDAWTGRGFDDDPMAYDSYGLLNWALRQQFLRTGQPSDRTNDRRDLASFLNRHQSREASLPAPALVLATADGTAENEHVLIRGNHTKPGEMVERRFLEAMGGAGHQSPETGSGRLELARQIAHPANPFVTRVIVNRLWQHHFGRGIVPTPDNFGILGQPPSHPELLDYLAGELVRRDWSLKRMHRLMLLSGTYRMSSVPQPAAESADPENRLWHRMPVQRLEGEVIRDAILAISGRLDRRMEGASVLPHLTPFMEGRGRPQSGPLDGNGRRSVYISVRRNFLSPMFLAFDLPTPLSTMGRRSTSNVPAQALTLMNNPLVIQQARVWADRALATPADSREVRVGHLYETAFGRLPTADEISAATLFLDEQGRDFGGPNDPRTWADLCHVLLNVKEFIFIR